MRHIDSHIERIIAMHQADKYIMNSDGLLDSVSGPDYTHKRWWTLPYQHGFHLVAILATAAMMISFILYFGITYINDVLLYKNKLTINSQGAFTPQKALNCEYALYLFNTADLWANSGIQVNENDYIRINISGALNSTLTETIDAADNNLEERYRWMTYGNKRNVVSQKAEALEYCITRAKKNFQIGDALFTIMPESANLQNDPLQNVDGIQLWSSKEWGRDFHRAGRSGTLYFAVNDLCFSRDEDVEYFYKSKDTTDLWGNARTSLFIDAQKNKNDRYPAYADNLGQLLVAIEIQRHVPYAFFRPLYVYRDFEYDIAHIMDGDSCGIVKFLLILWSFLKFFVHSLIIMGLYLLLLLVALYSLFVVGHWLHLLVGFRRE